MHSGYKYFMCLSVLINKFREKKKSVSEEDGGMRLEDSEKVLLKFPSTNQWGKEVQELDNRYLK